MSFEKYVHVVNPLTPRGFGKFVDIFNISQRGLLAKLGAIYLERHLCNMEALVLGLFLVVPKSKV